MGEMVEELCRLCASFDPVKMPIFSAEGLQRNLVNKILTCLHFKVKEEDGFPSSVCYKCMFNLESFYDFYETSLRAQSKLYARIIDGGGKADMVVPVSVKMGPQPGPEDLSRPRPPPVPHALPLPHPLSLQPHPALQQIHQQHPLQPPPAHPASGVPNVERPFPCDLCPTSFMSAKDRWTHVSQNHKGDARITCIFCRKGFSTISNLTFHKRNKHREEMEEWERKMKPLPKLQKINDLPRMQASPLQNKTYETVRNFLSNKTESLLQDARQADLANFNVKIGNTDIKFGVPRGGVGNSENKSMIDRLKNLGVEVSTGNIRNNELRDEDKFQAPEDLLQLDIGLEPGDNLENMIESETIFGCEVCMRDFKDRSSLWLHMLYSHKNEAGYTCGMCLRLCGGYQQLHEHVTTCTELNEQEKRRYFCNICFRQHESKKKLETHTLIHNLTDPWIQANFDINNLISCNPTATEKIKMEEAEAGDGSEFSDAYSQEMDMTNDSTQHSTLNQQDALAYQSFLENTGHFLESSFFDNVKVEPEVKAEGGTDDANKFRCEDCFRVYDTAIQLTKHKYNVHKNPNRLLSRNDSFGNPVYECEYCGETYEDPKQLMKHRYNVHRTPHQTPAAAANAAINPASATTTPEEPKGSFQCSDCSRVFETPRQLQKHKYNVHKTIRKVPVNVMGGESPSSGESLKPTFHYSYTFDCELCGERAASKTERWKHCFKKHRDDTRLCCEFPDCKKVMPTQSFKKEHELYHEQQGKFPICCEICSKLWTSKVEFWKHVSGVHYSLVGLTCGVCMKMFTELEELKEHVKSHEPLSDSEFNCDICGRGYSSKPKMTRHRLIHENDPDNDDFNILKNTLLKGGQVVPGTGAGNSPGKGGKYEILNIPKVNRSFENDMEIIEVNPDDNGLDGDQDDVSSDQLWCDVCPDLTFTDLDELRAHRRNIHALYPCDLCPKFYGGVSHLWKHTNRSHKNHPDITCTHCGKTSASRIQLRGHINKNHKEILLGHMVNDGADPDPTNLNCQRCGKEFKIRSMVRRHERSCLLKDAFDPDPTNLNCQKCGKYYPIRSLVRRHERICLNPKEPLSLACKVCGKEFPKRSYCRRHERTCGTKEKRPPKEEGPVSLQCEWCPKVFNNRRAYAGHVDYMHSLVECEVCTEERVTFRSKTELYNHCKEKHPTDPNLLCPHEKCQRLLRSKADLEKHQRDHKNRDNPPTCEFCADVFKGRKKLRIHILHQHKTEENRKFICGICVRVCEDTHSLMAHIQQEHSKLADRDYTCRICARAYNCNAKVLDHMKNTHDTSFKPCRICLKVFEDEKELETHVKEHSIKDANQCYLCHETFMSVLLLYEHVKENHPDLRENSCGICGRKYHSAYTCFDHMENKHGEGFHCCRKCFAVFTDPEAKAKHMEDHGLEDLEHLTCTRCSSRQDSEEAMETHIREAHADLFEEFADRNMCLICSKVLKYKYSIFVHIEKHHKGVFGCRSCLMIYNDKAELDAHYIKLHTRDKDGNPPLFSPGALNSKTPPAKKTKNQCFVCQTMFTTTELLRLHVASDHPDVLKQDSMCTICGHGYSSRFKVYYHVVAVHGDPYKCCRKCGKILMNAAELEEHDAIHANEPVKKSPAKRNKTKEEPVVNHEKRTRPQRNRSKVLNNYVVDIDEEEPEEEGEDSENVPASEEADEEAGAVDEPSEEADASDFDEDGSEDDEEGDKDDEDSDEGEEEEESDEGEDDDESEEETESYEGKIAAKVANEEDEDENYTCEPGDENLKLKIKHNINSFKKEDGETEELTGGGSPTRKRKRSDVVNGTDGEPVGKRLLPCATE